MGPKSWFLHKVELNDIAKLFRLTLLQTEGKMLPMTEKTLKVRKQVTDVKYLSEMKKSSSETLTSGLKFLHRN